MKRCPSCQHIYADDGLTFCLNDGATLLLYDNDSTAPLREARATSPAPTEIITAAPTPPFAPVFHPSVPKPKSNAGLAFGLIALAAAALSVIMMTTGLVGAAADWNNNAVGGLIVGTMFVSLFGVVSGLAGVLRAVRGEARKLVPMMGLVANALYLLFIIALLVFGIAVAK